MLQWLNFYNKAGPATQHSGSKRKILCDLLTTSNLDTSKCDQVLGPASLI